MSAYLTAVLACAAVTALANLLAPESDKLGKYIKYISGLTALCVIASPLLSLKDQSFSLPEPNTAETGATETGGYGYDMEEAVLKEAERMLGEEIKSCFLTELGIKAEDADVKVELDGGDPANVKVRSVTVTLRRSAVWQDGNEIERIVKRTLGKETEVKTVYE